MDDRERKYPGNSYSKIAPKTTPDPQKKQLTKVADGQAIQRKKSLGEKFAETFLAADMKSVAQHIVFDVLIPEIKNMLSDMIHGSTNMMLFGDRRGNRSDRDRNGGTVIRTNYRDRFDDRNGRRDDRDREPLRPKTQNMLEEIALRTQRDAEEVLENMLDHLSEYHVISIKEYYALVNYRTDNWAIDKWGWFELPQDLPIDQVREGFVLRLPKPQVID